MPTVRALECFLAVLDQGSFTAAAARLHMSQPALSHQLAVLEREVRAPLFERQPRGVRPTSVGRAIADDARLCLDAAARVVRVGRGVGQGRTGHLIVACLESMIVGVVGPALYRWRQTHPDVLMTVIEHSEIDVLVSSLSNGEADVGVTAPAARWNGAVVPIADEEIVAVASSDHAIREYDSLPFSRLAEHPVVHFHTSHGLSVWLDTVAAEHRATLQVAMRARNAITAAQLAMAGLGVAVVPISALFGSIPGTVRPFDPPLIRRAVALSASATDPLTQQFVQELTRTSFPQSRDFVGISPVDTSRWERMNDYVGKE